jgi:hypothetical protein
MIAYKDFIEVTTTAGKTALIRKDCIESIVKSPDKTMINIIGDGPRFYDVVDSYEDVKKMLGGGIIKTLEQVESELTCGEAFTTEQFAYYAHNNCLNAYDGFGYFHDGEKETDFNVWDNESPIYDTVSTWEELVEKYPYVIWYNK